MKFKQLLHSYAGLVALLLFTAHGHAALTPACEVSVAAMNLPSGSDGLIHCRNKAEASTPLQLSTYYFSARIKVEDGMIVFYEKPIPAGPLPKPPPQPLLAVKIPQDAKLVYVLLWSDVDERNQVKWKSSILNSNDWKAGSMKLLNTTSEAFGVTAGEKRFQLVGGKSIDLNAKDWPDSFAVKIFRLQPKLKTIFSSNWLISEGRRELCFLGLLNGSVSLRSIIDLGVNTPTPAPATN